MRILLDVMLKREPWVTEARLLWQANDRSPVPALQASTPL